MTGRASKGPLVYNTSENAGRYNKVLVAQEEIKRSIKSLMRRGYVEQNTLPGAAGEKPASLRPLL